MMKMMFFNSNMIDMHFIPANENIKNVSAFTKKNIQMVLSQSNFYKSSLLYPYHLQRTEARYFPMRMELLFNFNHKFLLRMKHHFPEMRYKMFIINTEESLHAMAETYFQEQFPLNV